MATKDDYIRYWESQGISLAALESVVRCKDCKFFKTYPPTENQDYTIYDCERLLYCTDNAVNNNPDDFCSKGKRKNEAET